MTKTMTINTPAEIPAMYSTGKDGSSRLSFASLQCSYNCLYNNVTPICKNFYMISEITSYIVTYFDNQAR